VIIGAGELFQQSGFLFIGAVGTDNIKSVGGRASPPTYEKIQRTLVSCTKKTWFFELVFTVNQLVKSISERSEIGLSARIL
jgi:hypothetical protein